MDSISPQTLSTKMLGVSKYNLNLISYDSAIGMVNAAIAAGVNVTQLFVDTVGDAERYTERRACVQPRGIRRVLPSKLLLLPFQRAADRSSPSGASEASRLQSAHHLARPLLSRRLNSLFQGVKCIAKAKADSLFPVVSAASIVAKARPCRARRLVPWRRNTSPDLASATARRRKDSPAKREVSTP